MNNQVTMNKEDTEKNLQNLFYAASSLLNKESDNYLQGFVFRCLNILKGKNKDAFYWEVIRLINARKDNLNEYEKDRLIQSLEQTYTTLDDETFFQHAYTFLLGLLKTKTSNNE